MHLLINAKRWGMMTKPTYYEALWRNCMKCKIHYMSAEPHLRAYLCDECWNSMPHYRTTNIQKVKKGPTHNLPHILRDISLTEIMLYTVGNLICVVIVLYYLWFK